MCIRDSSGDLARLGNRLLTKSISDRKRMGTGPVNPHRHRYEIVIKRLWPDPLSALRNRFDGPLPPGALGSEDHEMALEAFLGGRRYEARVTGSQRGRERRDEATVPSAMATRGTVVGLHGRVDDPPLTRTEVVDRDDLGVGRDLAVATEDPGVAAPHGGERRHRERRRQDSLELHRDHLAVDH